MKCCGRLLKPKRFCYTDDEGLKTVKVAECNNLKCCVRVVEIEKISLFGRTEKQTLRGKKADKFLEANETRFLKEFRVPRGNTAKGYHYCNTFWDLKKNKIKMQMKELTTDRTISSEEKELLTPY